MMRSKCAKLVVGAVGLGIVTMMSGALTGCSSDTDSSTSAQGTTPGSVPAPAPTTSPSPSPSPAPTTTPVPSPEPAPAKPAPKAVYTLSNETASNAIVIYSRSTDGVLTPQSSFATGGKGSGGGLGDQGALVFEAKQNRFFAVNAGDDSISMLALEEDGNLSFEAKIASGGTKPISLTVAGDLVYVLNTGDDTHAANISGFRISGKTLSPIAGSTRPLSADQPGPAQIQFTPDSKLLVVTEKGTNTIDTYAVSSAGVAAAPKSQASAGMTPFGFAFSADSRLVVSEAFGGADNAGATSSYSIASDGTLSTVTGSAGNLQSAPCWVAIVNGYAYVTNTRTDNVTAYKVAPGGGLTLLDASGSSATTGAGPIDLDATDGNDFLYTLNNRDHSISTFAINANGTLTKKADYLGVPSSAIGLIAR